MKRLLLVIATLLSLTVLLAACKRATIPPLQPPTRAAPCPGRGDPAPTELPPMRPTS